MFIYLYSLSNSRLNRRRWRDKNNELINQIQFIYKIGIISQLLFKHQRNNEYPNNNYIIIYIHIIENAYNPVIALPKMRA